VRAIWTVVRDFGNYEWAGVIAETLIEAGKPGDSVGPASGAQLPGDAARHADRRGESGLRRMVGELRLRPRIGL
jgi:hypothetical protein